MADNVSKQSSRYPDLKERLGEFWMYSPCAEKRIPDDMREAVAWAWDEIVKARDELTTPRARQGSALELLEDLKERRWILRGDEGEFCGYAACWSNRLEGLLDAWLAEDWEG